jgi:hypothetical protein
MTRVLLTHIIKRPLDIRIQSAVVRRELPAGRGAIRPGEGDRETEAGDFPVTLENSTLYQFELNRPYSVRR